MIFKRGETELVEKNPPYIETSNTVWQGYPIELHLFKQLH